MNILFLLPSLELGGAERQAILLAKMLRDQAGCQVAVHGFCQPGRAAALCDAYGIPWSYIPFPLVDVGGGRRLAHWFREVRKLRPDVMLSYCAMPNVLGAMMWPLLEARCIWGQRDAGMQWHEGLRPYLPYLTCPVYGVANSFSGTAYLKYLALGAGVHHIQNVVQEPAPMLSRSEWRERLGLPHDALVACMVANLTQLKRHDIVIQAWERAAASAALPPNTYLVLAGYHGETSASLQNMVAQAGLGDRILFPGAIDDVAGFLSACDMGVFASESEGLPNGVLESMAAGLAMVALDIEGTREALGAESENTLVSGTDIALFSQALQEMLGNPQKRERAAAQNVTRIRSHFGPGVALQKYVSLLEDIQKLPAASLGQKVRALCSVCRFLCKDFPQRQIWACVDFVLPQGSQRRAWVKRLAFHGRKCRD